MIRVLMVDDDPNILELTRIFLVRSGDILVDTTESAAESLEKLNDERCPYEVVISDYAMPEMDGITFLKAVRNRTLDLPFILFTGKSREEVVIEALNCGADYYMQKDGNPKVLFAELSHQIRQAADRERARKGDLIQRELALKLSGATTLSLALKLCVEAAIEISGTDCGTMYLLDGSSGSFILSHSIGFSSDFIEAISQRKRSPSSSLIAKAKKPIYIRSQDRDLPLQEAREREGLRAMAVVPVHHEGEVIGYYSVGTHTSDEVPPSRRSALETIAAMTGNAIVRLQTEEEHRKSEEQLQAIFEAAENISFIITDAQDPDPTILEFSPGAEKIFGYKHEEVVGKTVSRLHLSEDVAIFPEMHRLMREGKRGFSGSTTLVRKSGEKFPALFSTYPLFDEKGNMRAALGVSIDITDQKRTEEALRNSEEKYRTLVEDQTDLICRFLPDGTLTFVNDAYCRYFGKSRDELVGCNFMLLIPEEDRQKTRDHLASLSIDRPVATCVHRVNLPECEVRWQQWTDRAILDEEGDVVEFQSSGQDITDRKLAEEALKETNKKLNLLGSVTRHDLMNRISAIEGYAQMLSEMVPTEPSMQKCASSILDLVESARRQIAFTRDYQDMGVKAPRWQRVETLAEKAASSVHLNGIRLKLETGPVEVFADPLIEKVFINLLDNSVMHGEITADIRISFRDLDDLGVILFEDDGVGVAAPHKERIFHQAFGRNTGYGLFLAREILGITGISIRETGLEGEGARFEIKIPKEHYRMAPSS